MLRTRFGHRVLCALVIASGILQNVRAEEAIPELRCSYEASCCHAPSTGEAFAQTELFFGLSRPGGDVSEEEFRAFLEDYVTVRYAEGFTVLAGMGQFRGAAGVTATEKSKVPILLCRSGRSGPTSESKRSAPSASGGSTSNRCFAWTVSPAYRSERSSSNLFCSPTTVGIPRKPLGSPETGSLTRRWNRSVPARLVDQQRIGSVRPLIADEHSSAARGRSGCHTLSASIPRKPPSCGG